MREDAGMTQSELGQLIGVSERVLGYYESNDRVPKKPETLQKISEVFHVSIDSLFGQEEAFIQNAGEQFGRIGFIQAQDVLRGVQAIFAGGELPEEDRDEFFRLVAEMYFDAKQKNKKYGRRK
jgi:transcriptional regulator with XRE-family HTH domain